MTLTALSINSGFDHVKSFGSDDPVNTHTYWTVDYTYLTDDHVSVDHSRQWHLRETAIHHAIEILQGEL